MRKDVYSKNHLKKYFLIFGKPPGETGVFKSFCIRFAGCQAATFKRYRVGEAFLRPF